MMDPVFYVLAIMGCGDDGYGCRQARVEPVRYSSYAACREASGKALLRHTDLSYPVIAADCREGNARMARRARNQAKGG